MLLTFNLLNDVVQLRLDWTSRRWKLVSSRNLAWVKGLAANLRGRFEIKDWRVMWLMDDTRGANAEPLVILWDPPRNSSDSQHRRGTARIHAPASAHRNSKIPWEVSGAGFIKPKAMTPLRQYVVRELEKAFVSQPIKFGDTQYKRLMGGYPEVTDGTNCLALGSGIAKLVAEYKGMREPQFTKYILKMSLAATTGLPAKAKNNSWKDADGKQFPGPGDFFALLNADLTNTPENRASTNITHVGAILDIKGTAWRTGDFGQNASVGGEGCIRERTYSPESNRLNSPKSARKPRVLAGWVDIDEHFG